MTSAPRRNDAYIAEITSSEIDRLVTIAATHDAHVKDGFRRTGIGQGSRVVDIGCGALGGLLSLSDIVGPDGLVVGLDLEGTSLERARSILDQQRRQNVQLIHANINDLDPSAICPPGPFDAAYCRFFLIHQADPATTLRRMAALVRPGGYLVSHDVHFVVVPSLPEAPILGTMLDLWARTMRARGASPAAATDLPTICATLGLRVVSQRGYYRSETANPAAMFDYYHATTSAARRSAIESGAATAEEVDAVLAELTAAGRRTYQLLASVPTLELIAQVPG